MSQSANLGLRLTALALVVVIVQAAALSQVTVFGTSVDLVPLVAAFAGLLCGSLPGAVFGFAIGLFADLALAQDLGVSSLLLVALGYAAGRLREDRDPAHTLVPLAVGAVATLVFGTGLTLIQLMLGVDAPVSVGIVGDLLTVTVLNALIALPVHALVRRVLGPALPESLRRRRRRAYSTSGLSPLSSSTR